MKFQESKGGFVENGGSEESAFTKLEADEALQTLQVAEHEHLTLDPATSRRLRLRADLFIMPLLCLVYGIQFLDRTTLSYSNAMGLSKALHLTLEDYSWTGSVFFFGFLGSEFLTGRALQRLPVGKYLGICVVLWGIVQCCFAATTNYGGAIGIRFILGVLQACVSPALLLIVSQWYTKSEQSLRVAIWVSASGFAQIFGGLVAYGIALRAIPADPKHPSPGFHPSYSLPGWKVVFLVFGCITLLVGALVLALLPDSQLNARWLSKEDRILAVQRVRVNQQGIGNKKFKWYQFKEAMLDPMVWMIVFYAIAANIPNGGLTNFFSQLIQSFGFTPRESILYGCPAGAVAIVSILLWGILSQYVGHRLFWGTLAMVVALLGAILVVALPLHLKVGRLIGYYLTTALPAGEAAVISLISSNIAGYTKKTTVAALFFIGYCVGNIIGPQTFREKDAPRFVTAEITIIVLFAVCVVDMIIMIFYIIGQNKKKLRERSAEGYIKKEGTEFWDLTDKENKEFVYST